MSAARGFDFAGEFFRRCGGDDVDQRELLDRLAVERAVADEARRELAPDHAGGAGDRECAWIPTDAERSSLKRPFARAED